MVLKSVWAMISLLDGSLIHILGDTLSGLWLNNKFGMTSGKGKCGVIRGYVLHQEKESHLQTDSETQTLKTLFWSLLAVYNVWTCAAHPCTVYIPCIIMLLLFLKKGITSSNCWCPLISQILRGLTGKLKKIDLRVVWKEKFGVATMNVWTKCHDKPSDSCWDILVWIKMVDCDCHHRGTSH